MAEITLLCSIDNGGNNIVLQHNGRNSIVVQHNGGNNIVVQHNGGNNIVVQHRVIWRTKTKLSKQLFHIRSL